MLLNTLFHCRISTKRCWQGPNLRDWARVLLKPILAGLFYTGGTTGASKGVMLTHRNLIANALNWLGLGAPDRE